MKSLFFISLIPLLIPTVSEATWKTTPVLYDPKSGETYNNQELHIYNNQFTESITLNGKSHFTINGGSLLSNSVFNNRSVVHIYSSSPLERYYPVISNTQFNDQSLLIMETNSLSLGTLFIAKGARLNIVHDDNVPSESFLNQSEKVLKKLKERYIEGNVVIEDLDLAGTAFIGPTTKSAGYHYEYRESDYRQQSGPMIITHIDNLTMQPGSKLSLLAYIPRMQFNQLQINTLSGSGKFILDSHLAAGLSDTIVVREQASGNFGLKMMDSGYEPVTSERVDVISVNRGDARFTLLNKNGVVEAGVWQYTLQHEQNGEHSLWYLSNQQPQSAVAHDDNQPEHLTVPPVSQTSTTKSLSLSAVSQPSTTESSSLVSPESLAASPTALLPPAEPQSEAAAYPLVNQTQYRNPKPVLSRSAQAVINMASATRQVLTTEMSTFRQRMGAVRSHQKNLSVWTRYLKDDSHHARHSGAAFQTHLQGLQIGLDKRSEFNAGDWLLGSYVSDSKTAVQSDKLTHGKIRSQGGGLYATWLDRSGFYWDNVFKLNRLRHEIRTEMNSGQLAQGHYSQNGLSFASEAGYSLNLNPMLTLTPYGKVSYFRTRKVDSVLDNGLASHIPQATNVDGEAGLLLEVPISLGQPNLRPYLKAAISRELVGDNTLKINGTPLALPETGTLGKYGLGSTLQIADDVSAWAEMDYQKGRKTESPMSASLGVRVSF